MARWSQVKAALAEKRKVEWPKFVLLEIDSQGNLVRARTAPGTEQEKEIVESVERWWKSIQEALINNPESVQPLLVELLAPQKPFSLIVHSEHLPR